MPIVRSGSGGGSAGYTDEQVRDVVAATLVQGANVTITPNDGADTITIAAATSGASGIPASIADAKGDLIAGTANDTVARLAVGTDGLALVAASGQTTGLQWAAPAPASHNHSGADLTSGTVATARLGSGTANSTTFLCGDQTWANPDKAPMVTNTQTGTAYTLVAADAGAVVEMNNASAMTVTVPPNAAVAFAVGTVVELCRLGAGTLTVSSGTGVTLRTPSSLTARAQYSTISLRKRGTDEWVVSGDTS